MAADPLQGQVRIGDVKISQKRGRFLVSYPCPRCHAPLSSHDSELLDGDCCPTCGAALAFDAEIQLQFHTFLAAKQGGDAAAVQSRELAKAEREAKRAERDREAGRIRKERTERERKADMREAEFRKRREVERTLNLFDVQNAVTLVILLSSFIALSATFLGFSLLNGSGDGRAQIGISLITSALCLGLTLPLIAKLFRCLIAMHSVLVRILQALENASSSPSNGDEGIG